MFVVFEGIDASGKDTVADVVADALDGKKINFPDREAVTGPLIDGYLKNKWSLRNELGEEMSKPYAALMHQALQVTNRMERMDELEEVAGSPDEHVVAVRYYQSGWVYGQLDGVEPTFLKRVHGTMARPDLHLLLDVSVDVAIKRMQERGDAPERYENPQKMLMAAELYRELWEKKGAEDADDNGWWDTWRVVDADQDFGSVLGDVFGHVMERRASL